MYMTASRDGNCDGLGQGGLVLRPDDGGGIASSSRGRESEET